MAPIELPAISAGGLEEREGGEVDVARAAAATADEDQVPLAHFPVEPLQRKAVPKLLADLVQRRLGDGLRLARCGQELVRSRQRRALRIEQRPEHLDQLLPVRSEDGRHRHVAPVRSADVPAAAERERVTDDGLVALIQPAARRHRRAGQLRLHGGDRTDLREPFLEQAHAVAPGAVAPSTRKNAPRTSAAVRW
jgi:hypothetical protein